MQLCEQVQAEMVSTDAIQKTDRSPVTVADFGSQALICEAIARLFQTTRLSLRRAHKPLERTPHFWRASQVM